MRALHIHRPGLEEDGGPVELPEGVSTADWGLEKVRYQNPRIRAFLGCVRMLDETIETDYHIMHCSPSRLLQIWRQVRDLAETMRSRLAPSLAGPSHIRELEQARQGAAAALAAIDSTLLEELDGFPEQPNPVELFELRKLLCVAMGQLQTLLYESFGRIIAADPRSIHDADFYLSRRFPMDVEESEFLLDTVGELNAYLSSLDGDRERLLSHLVARLIETDVLPSAEEWSEASVFLVGLYNDLTSRIKEILCLHGIRFEEMHSLNRYAAEIPTKCLKIFEIHELSGEVFEALEATAEDGNEAARCKCREAVARRLARLVDDIDRTLRDLIAFVPLWLHNIERRRALVLSRGSERAEDASPRQQASLPVPATPLV